MVECEVKLVWPRPQPFMFIAWDEGKGPGGPVL